MPIWERRSTIPALPGERPENVMPVYVGAGFMPARSEGGDEPLPYEKKTDMSGE
jgi:hypothetical protein